MERDTPGVSFTAPWKISTLHKACSVSGSTQLGRGRAVISQVLVASKAKFIISRLWPLKLYFLSSWFQKFPAVGL